jgi:alpha-L-fucosidase
MKTFTTFIAAALILSLGSATAQEQDNTMTDSEPTIESIDQHPLPEWFEDAKLGIFVNWGLYSVPGWAPTSAGELGEVDDKTWFANNSYAEWYWNTMRIDGSPGQKYHRETYGESTSYDDFAPLFKEAIQGWNPDGWADLFHQVGAQYVVFDTKHHDGFLLWPSQTPNPHKEGWQVERDLAGELSEAVRARDMRFGVYYSGGIDWSFNPVTVTRMADLGKAVPQTEDYAQYATTHYRELIDRYQPAVLWNDISFPSEAPILDLFAYYYDRVPEGVINDRWASFQELSERMESEGAVEGEGLPYDFSTPEYQVYETITPKKWEATRGLGLSFGYNRNTKPENMLSVDELVDSFVDIVSKNGNLLLNVGPKADGTIPELQAERLRGFGKWLSTNGEAIFGTRPWVEAEGKTQEQIEVRFTEKRGTVYATLLSRPTSDRVVIENILLAEGAEVELLSHEGSLGWEQQGPELHVDWPSDVESAPAYVLKLTPQPWRLQQK